MTRRVLIAGAALLAAAFLLYRYRQELAIRHATQEPVTIGSLPEESRTASSNALRLSFLNQPQALPDLRFADREGRSLSLQDFRSRPVLLNIWATWCIPCRQEMPALDRLQAEIGASALLVLPLSIDREGLPVVKKFYDDLGLTSLGIYIDQSGKASSDLSTVGIPTTLIINRDGQEVGRKIGPAEWDSAEIVALIRAHLQVPPTGQQTSP